MRRIIAPLLGTLLLATTPLGAAPRLSPEAKLSRALEGREAGAPVKCISLNRVHSTQVIDDTAILYDLGSTIYVNRPDAGAESLDQWDVLVTRLHSQRLCDYDVVDLYDRDTRSLSGAVFLGEFVPYRKIGRGAVR